MHPPANSLVLIVDDTPENITAVSCLLQDICEVAAATSGAEAIELAQALAPDLILLDVLMPDMDGFATCRKLKEDPETAAIPIIFVTSLDSPEDKLEGFAVGAVDYVTKPFHAGELRARVRTQLRIRNLEKTLLQSHPSDSPDEKSSFNLLDKINQIFLIAEPDDSIRYLNSAWVTITQKPTTAALGRLFPDLLHTEDREPVARALSNAKKHNLPQTYFDIHLPVPGGTRRMRAQVNFDYDNQNQCTGWSAFLTDITDLLERIEIQRKTLDSTRITNASKIESLQDAAQALREPLFALSTSFATIKALALPSEAFPALSSVSCRLHELHHRLANLLERFSSQTSDPSKPVSLQNHPASAAPRSFDIPVLVADDSPVNLRILVHLLRRIGFHDITSASNGQEAKELFRLRNHQLIILDQQMPILDGPSAAREILALASDPPPVLIALTASIHDNSIENARRAGFHTYLAKPITFTTLRDHLIQLGWQTASQPSQKSNLE